MPNRLSAKERYWAYLLLVNRDGGDRCRICGKTPREPFTLDIDHIDNDPKNNDPDNLQLACKPCNQRKEIEYRYKRRHKVINISPEGSPATRMVKDAINYKDGSAEMKANGMFEVPFRKWLLKEIAAKGFVEKGYAKNSGAELVGCSPTTIVRYIDKLTSAAGSLQEVKDALNNKLLIFNDEVQHGLDVIERRELKKKKEAKKTRKSKETLPVAPESPEGEAAQ